MQLTIDKLIYGGDGLARLPDGKAAFVPFALPGERVEAEIREQKPGFARARLSRVIEASPQRTTPGCPYFGECGGCHYQHASYDAQLDIKRDILRESLLRLAKVELERIELHASPPWNYRNRTRMKLRAAPFAIGYYRFASHSLLPVRECPISSPLINRAIATMWKLGEAGAVPEEIAEIEFFADGDDERLLVELTLAGKRRPDWPRLAKFAGALRSELDAVTGVAVFTCGDREGITHGEEIPERWQAGFGAGSLRYAVDPHLYIVSAGSFFQTNRFLAAALLNLATESRCGGHALDLYAGTGLFSLPLSQTFREVAAVEAAPFSFADLKRNAPSNVTSYGVAVDKFLARLPREARFDYVIVDPPRGGLGEKVALALTGLAAPEITYVSCDPATLARDLRPLRAAGYEIQAAHLVDLFPQTFHIETVLHLKR